MASVPDAAIKLFSQRSRMIEQELDAQGLTRDTASGGMKQAITKNTRKRKDEGDRAALRQEWRDALKQAGIEIPEAAPENRVAPPRVPAIDDRGGKPVTPDQSNSGSSMPKEPPPSGSTGEKPGAQSPQGAGEPQSGKKVDQGQGAQAPGDSGSRPGGGGGPSAPADEKVPAAVVRDEPASPLPQETKPQAGAPARTPEHEAKTPEQGIDRSGKAKAALEFAIEHLTERQGIFTRGELLERAYLKALGGVAEIDRELERAKADGRLLPELPLYQTAKSFSRESQTKAVDKQFEKFRHDNDLQKLTRASWVSMLVHVEGYDQARAEKTVDGAIASGRLVETEERYTTTDMRNRELRILWMERLGRETVAPIKSAAEVDAMLANSDLNAGQRDAAKLVLTTTNRVVGIQGFAGVGKSHALSKQVNAIKEESQKQARVDHGSRSHGRRYSEPDQQPCRVLRGDFAGQAQPHDLHRHR
jgi:hypothetical protein